MIYRHEQSLLGFGCMRFKRSGNGFDMEEIERELKYAIDNGVNYFDTAYIYPGSEEVLGTVLEHLGARSKVKIATKLPHNKMRTMEEADKLFAEQLQRLRTDYVDNFLMHMLPDSDTWNALVERGVLEWIRDKKESGKIKNIGFSYHGSFPVFEKLLNAYDWDFCQIQYNYMDETSQAGVAGLRAAAAKGIPVIIMEPLRGGKLADKIPASAEKIFKKAHPDWSNAEWSFRWLFNQPEVTTVLSGMNSMEMLQENIKCADEANEGSFTEEDFKALSEAKSLIQGSIKVGCTGCGYCMPCPAGVDIPGCFRCINAIHIDGFFTAFKEYFMCTTLKKQKGNAALCKQCGLCETKCPQHIKIREELKKTKRIFENPIYHIGKLATKIMGMH